MENTSTFSTTPAVDHPQAGSVQTLGVLGLIFTFVASLVGLILNIICLAKAGNAMGQVKANPAMYTEASVKKIKAGRTCAIIGLSIQGFVILIVIILIAANA